MVTTIYGFIYAFMQGNAYELESYMTLWGVWACTLYFILIHSVSKGETHTFTWKLTYLLGEMGFCFEFLIVPFFWLVLYPFLYGKEDWNFFVFNVFCHFVTGMCIFVEFYHTPFQFPTSHRIILIIIGVVYTLNNFLWTELNGHPVYPVITWKSLWTVFYLILSFVIALIGFEFGRWHYKKKKIAMKGTEPLRGDDEENQGTTKHPNDLD
mmetsp:Transcript_16117/g.13653  ORF Transcript_16117/g.13653 Transcript_16117/m.13653 type:complete len:210 (+) Transcript_16117:152-781(+)